MEDILLFTDGSINTQSKVGFGAYLAVSDNKLSLEVLNSLVKLKRFEQTSSTKLELQTLLWALNEINLSGKKVKIFTDSQNLIGLLRRRERLEKNNFISKNNKRLNNDELYQEFYKITDELDIQIFKVSGHKASGQKDDIDKLFTLVDRASRKALRENQQ